MTQGTKGDAENGLRPLNVFCSGKDNIRNDVDRLKETDGKLNLTLVPRKIILAIAKVREYGNKKYGTANPDNWKANPRQQYNEAAFRHFIDYLDDNESLDPESGLPHLHHLACNIAFLIEGGFKGD